MLEVYTYGSGECDQLGLGDSDILEAKNPKKVPILNVEPSSKVYQICCGGMHTLVLTTLGKIYSWGCNDDGALGRSGIDNQPVMIDSIPYPMNNITAGDSFSIAYNTELNLVYQWGAFRNNAGKIADPITTPVALDRKLFANKVIKKIISGSNHALAIAGRSLFGWGDCELGQIGKLASKPDLPIEWSLVPHQFETKEVLDVFTACNHSFSISKKGKREVFKAWGLNNWGQLGIGNKTNTCVPTEVEFFMDKKVKYATGGDHHSIVLLENGEIYAWGRNDEGQCGLPNRKEEQGDENDFSIEQPTKVPKLAEEMEIESIKCSMNYNYAISEKHNEIYTWGMGESYVLGNKKDDNEAEPFKVPKEFYFNKRVAKVSLGSSHVAVCLCDPATEELPQLEYDLESAREELRRKFLEGRAAPKKRKFDLGVELRSEDETHKRNRKKVDYVVDKKIRTKKNKESAIKKPATATIKKTNTVNKKKKEEKEETSEDKKVIADKHDEQDVTAKKRKSVDKSDPEHDKEMAHEEEEPKADVVKEVKKKANKKVKV